MKKIFFAVIPALALAVLLFAGCDKSKMKDDARRAAEATTSLGDRIGQGLTDASERVSEDLSEAGSRVREGVTEAGEVLSSIGEDVRD